MGDVLVHALRVILDQLLQRLDLTLTSQENKLYPHAPAPQSEVEEPVIAVAT